jgi:hypothetical protein
MSGVHYAAVHEHRRLKEAWGREHAGRVAIPLDAFDRYPRAPHWAVLHRACDPQPESDDYWIGVERIRSLADVVAWSGHLVGKTWLPATDWAVLLRRIGREAGGSL